MCACVHVCGGYTFATQSTDAHPIATPRIGRPALTEISRMQFIVALNEGNTDIRVMDGRRELDVVVVVSYYRKT